MPYVGTGLVTNFASTIRDNFTGDGSATSFTLSRNAHHENDLEVFIGNVRQQPGSAYTVSGTTLAFTGTPANGEVIYVVHQAGALQTVDAPADHGNRDFNLSGDANKITFGIDKEVTVTHVADSGLVFKNTNTTSDKPFTLVLQTGETDIAASDKLGVINFQAPDEGTGTDAILVAAGIEAVSEGDFSSSSNATKLSFKTAASAAAAETMSLSSGGNLTVSGNVNIGGDLDVTGTVSFSENNVTDVGILSLDTLRGDADTNTSIVFSGSDVITIATGGTTAMTIDASQNTTLAGTLTAVTSIGIGSAVLTEAELETIDGITAGTAAASKALVLDSNKDIGTIRNLTIDGTFSDGNYTFDTSGNVSGLGTVASGNITSSGTVQGTTITATTAFVPDASDGAALGTTSLEFSDLFLADAAVINFGADQDINITHVADTGLTTNGSFTASGTMQGTTITATTAFVPDASGGADLGSTSLEFGDVFIADDKAIKLGSDQDATIEYDEDGTDRLVIGGANVTFGKSVLGSVETANKTGDSVALDFATYQNFLLTFTGNVTLTNPTTETVGQSGFIVIKQDGTGSRTLSLGTQYVTVGNATYTLSTAANAIDLIPYVVQADGVILLGNPSLAFA